MYKLDYIAVKISGNYSKLLDGTVSNTLDSNYNAFLDRNGKIVATFYQILSEDHIIIVFGNEFYDRFLQHLDKYLKLIPCDISKMDYKVYFDESNSEEVGEVIKLPNYRIILTKDEIANTITKDEFNKFRLENNIPLQGIDFDSEMALNISEKFVSFTKGCFLGQEIVARIHNTAKPPRRLVVKYENELGDDARGEITSKVTDDGRGKGFCLVKNS